MVTIRNPKEYFHSFGNLHDARINGFHWLPEEKRLHISIDDLNSNFEGLPEYEGPKPGMIILEGVSEIEAGICPTGDSLNIYDFTADMIEKELVSVDIRCWPGGKICVKCESIQLEYRITG